ncbi:MAG: hypothetical protein SWI22_12905 [Pseudomonadota bacterium]|nr:hypothetical protein [Pseudomonadota bacterium]
MIKFALVLIVIVYIVASATEYVRERLSYIKRRRHRASPTGRKMGFYPQTNGFADYDPANHQSIYLRLNPKSPRNSPGNSKIVEDGWVTPSFMRADLEQSAGHSSQVTAPLQEDRIIKDDEGPKIVSLDQFRKKA